MAVLSRAIAGLFHFNETAVHKEICTGIRESGIPFLCNSLTSQKIDQLDRYRIGRLTWAVFFVLGGLGKKFIGSGKGRRGSGNRLLLVEGTWFSGCVR